MDRGVILSWLSDAADYVEVTSQNDHGRAVVVEQSRRAGSRAMLVFPTPW
jgi:hypothetical protein